MANVFDIFHRQSHRSSVGFHGIAAKAAISFLCEGGNFFSNWQVYFPADELRQWWKVCPHYHFGVQDEGVSEFLLKSNGVAHLMPYSYLFSQSETTVRF